MTGHRIRLLTPDGEHEVACEGDEFILDRAEDEGLILPWGCRAGSCGSCAGKLLSGEVDQDEVRVLDAEQRAAGFVCLCVARPLSDCVIETHKHDRLSAGSGA